MDLGEHFLCLDVKRLDASLEFYSKLGFCIIEDHRPEPWAVIAHNNLTICLFEGIEENLINFRGGDVDAISREAIASGLAFAKPAREHPDGSWNATIYDPDGNAIFFNTFPREREQYVRTGTLSDRVLRNGADDRPRGQSTAEPPGGAKGIPPVSRPRADGGANERDR